ncbi:MAG TPA: MFS transporter [Rhizomicrobium sp.]|jgi:hypothetical protein
MAFFRNNAVNLFNFHYAIFSIAISGGAAFYAVFLVKSGVSVPLALIALGLTQAVRFAIRPMIVGVAARFGLRQTLVAGTFLSGLQYPLLAEVNGIGAVLYALVLVTAIADTFYWSSHHAYFAKIGDDEHRGEQMGVRAAAETLVGIFSPFLTGWLLVRFGPRMAFDSSAVITGIAVVPLFWAPDVKIARRVTGAYRSASQGITLFALDGWVAAGVVFVWQIGLFLSLGQNLLNYGGALAIAAVVGAMAGLVLGRYIDAGHGARMVWIAVGLFSAMIVLRALAVGNPVWAVAANALSPVGACLYVPAMMAAVYPQAKRSPCVLRFHVATEGGWDVGNVAGCFVSAGLIAAGLPLSWAILLSLLGTTGVFMILRRHYLRNPNAALAVAEDVTALPPQGRF